jgi:predicted lysophospholipase L1 biosynthesis ABC-type transport system permease subunit
MKQNQTYQKDIESIRQLMERSVKFLSLSGLSGILAGVYALTGAAVAYAIVQYPNTPFEYRDQSVKETTIILQLLSIAMVVLILSLITGYRLASAKAKKLGVKIWDATSKRLTVNLTIPLVAGGLFILILLANGHYGVAAPACLVFYGLALINASQNLFDEVRYLGYSEIILGLVSAIFPGYGLFFWAFGFGVLHIIYGAVMFKRYDR